MRLAAELGTGLAALLAATAPGAVPALAVSAATLLCAPTANAQDQPKINGGALRAIEDLGKELMRAGRLDDAEGVLRMLPGLGVDGATSGKVRERLNKEKRGTTDAKKDQALGGRARKAAGLLAQDLPRQGGDDARRALARAVLWFDSDLAAAHEALGRSATPDGYLDAAGQTRAQAQKDFAAAVLAARALEFEIESGTSTNPIVTALVQDHGGFARHDGFEMHTFERPALAASLLRQALRTRALLQWIRTGSFEFTFAKETPFVMTSHREQFQSAIDTCVRQEQLSESDAKVLREGTAFADRRKNRVFLLDREEMVAAWMARWLAPNCENVLDEGALDLACQRVLSCFSGLQQQVGKKRQRVEQIDFYLGDAANQDSYYAYAQSRGARHYLGSLGDQGRFDLARLLMVKPTACAGLPHVQGSVAVAYLLELGKARAFFDALKRQPANLAEAGTAVQAALGVAATAAEITAWLPPDDLGLAQQLDGGPKRADLRKAVDDARKVALGNVPHKLHATASWNAALDRGCEELLAERQGGPRTARGAEAATFAVTAEGADPAAAVRAMLRSVAGRAALLDVGTLEVGAAFANGVLCVDTGSVRHPVMTDCLAMWPSPGATDIPTTYGAGLPSPQAGVDPATLGYPLTIQLGVDDSGKQHEVGLRVREAGADTWLACHRFEPERPLAGCEHLLRTYGILPQAPLKPRAKYVFEIHLDKREVAHVEFTTGAQ